MKVCLVYTANENLMYNSYKLIAICDSKEKAMELIMPMLKEASESDWKDNSYKDANAMLNDLVYSMQSIDQTQCLSENYVFEMRETNKLLA